MNYARILATVAAGLVLGVGVPWAFMRMSAPALQASEKARAVNFRGRSVFYGLGIAWLIWAGCAIIGGVASANFLDKSSLPVLTLAGPLALVAFALGIVDDAYGTGESRGFRGHLGALAGGTLTTGGLKLVGIGMASLVVGFVLRGFGAWDASTPSWLGSAGSVIEALLASASIALTSNFVNLTDLRPGRALKVYSALALVGAACVAFVFGPSALDVVERVADRQQLVDFVVLAVFLLGPVVATWSYDLGERGMLGDAGANPMGAVAGMMIVTGLPFWGVVVFSAVMLGLNLASERVSFSRVIEGNRVLSWLDGLGRVTGERPAA